MDRRLQEACRSGDLAALKDLLLEDELVLDRAAASSMAADGPLHVAALLGHADLVREIVTVKPELARERNAHGSYPLHLAAANGHRQVVEEFLKADGAAALCLLQDGLGRLPVHVAVLRARVDAAAALITADGEAARAPTSQGESVLHLAVRSNNFEMVKFLVESLGVGEDEEFLNLTDERGNTALHLATATKQVQTLGFLASQPGVDMNATNQRGATCLDLLLELPCEHGDLVLGHVIFAAGGRVTSHENCALLARNGFGSIRSSPGEAAAAAAAAARTNPRRRTKPRSAGKSDDWVSHTPGTLMVVAVLISTVTFQAGMSPPGGFRQDDSHANSTGNGVIFDFIPSEHYHAGEAVLAKQALFNMFMAFDMLALCASMSIILLLLCVLPHRRRKLMAVLVFIMWIAVCSTGVAFAFGALAISPDFVVDKWPLVYYFFAWIAVIGIVFFWMLVRFMIYLFRKSFGKRNRQNVLRSGNRSSGGGLTA